MTATIASAVRLAPLPPATQLRYRSKSHRDAHYLPDEEEDDDDAWEAVPYSMSFANENSQDQSASYTPSILVPGSNSDESDSEIDDGNHERQSDGDSVGQDQQVSSIQSSEEDRPTVVDYLSVPGLETNDAVDLPETPASTNGPDDDTNRTIAAPLQLTSQTLESGRHLPIASQPSSPPTRTLSPKKAWRQLQRLFGGKRPDQRPQPPSITITSPSGLQVGDGPNSEYPNSLPLGRGVAGLNIADSKATFRDDYYTGLERSVDGPVFWDSKESLFDVQYPSLQVKVPNQRWTSTVRKDYLT